MNLDHINSWTLSWLLLSKNPVFFFYKKYIKDYIATIFKIYLQAPKKFQNPSNKTDSITISFSLLSSMILSQQLVLLCTIHHLPSAKKHTFELKNATPPFLILTTSSDFSLLASLIKNHLFILFTPLYFLYFFLECSFYLIC